MKTEYFAACSSRTWALLGCCLLAILLAVGLFQTHGIRIELDKSALQIMQLQRTERLARHFESRYSNMTVQTGSRLHPRVFWTDRLQVALAEFPAGELSFSIADPADSLVEFTGRPSKVLAREFLMQLSAGLDGDNSLVQLLNQLGGIDAELIHNRSCSVKRQENSKTLRLDCVYSIIDLVVRQADS